jgi:hypothetical protein
LLNVISGLLSGGAAPVADTAYESIATATANGSSRIISFSSIPSTYKHLQLRIFAQQSTSQYTVFNYNSDTTVANYYTHYLTGSGSAASAGKFSTFGGIIISGAVVGMGSGNNWSATVLDILDYANTNKNKTSRVLFGLDENGSGAVELSSGLWASTSAITGITFTNPDWNWTSGSKFALYGIKG